MADPSADGLLSYMYYVYVIKNARSGKIYIGQTENLQKRLNQHNDQEFDKRAYTKLNKGMWNIVHSETLNTRREAIRREKELKSSRGRNFIYTKILGR